MFGLGFLVGALIGLGVALYVNESWYKHSMKSNDSWYEFTGYVIDELSRADGAGDG